MGSIFFSLKPTDYERISLAEARKQYCFVIWPLFTDGIPVSPLFELGN